MSDWTWEYVPDASSVIGGLTPAQVEDVEDIASRIADAVACLIGAAPAGTWWSGSDGRWLARAESAGVSPLVTPRSALAAT